MEFDNDGDEGVEGLEDDSKVVCVWMIMMQWQSAMQLPILVAA